MTTALKTEIQARINAATIASTSTELGLLRLTGAELGCDLAPLDSVALALANSNANGVSLIELAKRVRAQAKTDATLVGGGSGVPVGAIAFFSDSTPHDFTIGGERFLRSGYVETDPTKFDVSHFKLSRLSISTTASFSISNFTSYLFRSIAASDDGSNIVAVTSVGTDNAQAESVAPKAVYSTNGGQTFSNVALGGFSTQYAPRDICFGNGIFVAVGDGGRISTSPTGQAWTARNQSVSYSFNRVIWTGSVFIVAGFSGSSGAIFRSADGVNWTYVNPSIGTQLLYIDFDRRAPNTIVAGNHAGANGIAVSTDGGATWVVKNISSSGNITSLCFAVDKWYVVTSSSLVGTFTTDDPVNGSWTAVPSNGIYNVTNAMYDPIANLFVSPDCQVIDSFLHRVQHPLPSGFSGPNKIIRVGSFYYICGSGSGYVDGIRRLNATPYAGLSFLLTTGNPGFARAFVRIS